MTRTEARREAKTAGLEWSNVEATYRELRIQQRVDRQLDCEVRQYVWNAYAYTEGSRDFWRHGMQKRFPKAFGDGDRTMIPNFDVVADDVAQAFPLFGRDNDPAATLFDFIAAPYNPIPSAEETWEDAIELAKSRPFAECPAAPVNDEPF